VTWCVGTLHPVAGEWSRSLAERTPECASPQVTASYVGTFTDGGQKFDASKRFGPFAVGNGEVISGWDLTILGAEAMPPMRVGGMRTVMLPPALAYGTRGAGCRPNGTCVIPPNSGLTFVIGLTNVAPARR
jgi:peptidylprolyl isomerase